MVDIESSYMLLLLLLLQKWLTNRVRYGLVLFLCFQLGRRLHRLIQEGMIVIFA